MWILNLLITFVLILAPVQPPEASARFDMAVRADFFAGFAGDRARFAEAMSLCERILAGNPRHAEALVWHGSGLLFQAGQAFARGDADHGTQFWERGLAEVNQAVALEPENVAVLIPRGAVLLQATRNTPPERGRPLLQQAVNDYERVLAIQSAYFDTLGDHPRGELLFGLAEGNARLGEMVKARHYFNRLIEDVPNSGQTPKARAFLANGELPSATGLGCVGCHQTR
jgi:tetratricopeptide (TPR) repeat protein